MEFMKLAKKRYSARKFSDRPVEVEKLEYVLEAGNIAPTAKNLQPQRIYVLQSREALDKLDTLTGCRYGAPAVLLFAYDADEEWKNPLEEGVHSGVEDVSIVATHVMLAATEVGLETCWCNYFANSKLEKAFNLPENVKSVLFMPIGYAAADAVCSPSHEKKKQIAETVKYL